LLTIAELLAFRQVVSEMDEHAPFAFPVQVHHAGGDKIPSIT